LNNANQANNANNLNDLDTLNDNKKPNQPTPSANSIPPPVKKEDPKDDFFAKKGINDEPMFVAEAEKEENTENPPAGGKKEPPDINNNDDAVNLQINVQQDEKKTLPPLNEIQVSDTAIPTQQKPVQPIIPQPIQKIHSPITPVVMVALIVAFIGFGGGFAAYRYLPGLTQKAATTADVATLPTDSNIQPPKSSKSIPSEVGQWPNYANTKYLYSISYPDTWYSQNANNPETDAVRFTNYNPEEKDEGSKIEIVLQNANGQDLKTWVEANNVTTNTNSAALSTIKVGTKEGYQQKTGYEVKTYLLQAGKVMIISLYSTATELTDSSALYQKVLDSLKLT
jgi:hypothetical protein